MLAQTQTQGRIKDPEINTLYHSQSLTKKTDAYGGGGILFNKWWWKNYILMCGRTRLDLWPLFCTKNLFKMSLTEQLELWNCQENMDKTLDDIDTGKDVLQGSPIAQEIIPRINKVLGNGKVSEELKETISPEKCYSNRIGENVCQYISGRGLASKSLKNSKNEIPKQQTVQS